MNHSPEEISNITIYKYKNDFAKTQIYDIIKNNVYSENWLNNLSFKYLTDICIYKNIYCYIIKSNSQVLSFAILKKNGNNYLLLFIYTMKKFREKGYASKLLYNISNKNKINNNYLIVNINYLPPNNLLIKTDKFNPNIFLEKYAFDIYYKNY